MLDSDRKGERHERSGRVLEFIAWAGIVRMSVEIELGVLVVIATTWWVLELVWGWADTADVLGGWRAVEARPLVRGEGKGVDRLYMGKKVCKVVTLVAIEDGGRRGGAVHRGGDSGVQVLRVKGIHRQHDSRTRSVGVLRC
jgi:hypothetical protein